MTQANVQDYQTLSRELDEVLLQLQAPEVSVDDALTLYKRGLELVKACEMYLKKAENSLTRLKLEAGEEE